LSVRPDALLTKATSIRLGQTLDADYLCYGSYDITLAAGDSKLRDGTIQVTARMIDLKKLHDGPDLSEAGKIAELSRLEEHLAWQSLKYLDPARNLPLDQFLTPRKLIRMDAEESYIRGLLSSNKDQQQKWFLQAVAVDPQFLSPAFELGKLALEGKDYRQAVQWLQRISLADPRYAEARFRMGLSAYYLSDYGSAQNNFHEVLKSVPLNEVYNNLGAAEGQTNVTAAIDDFHHALDGDQNDSVYSFNLGLALLKANNYEESAKRLEMVVNRDPTDNEARSLFDRAQNRQSYPASTGAVPFRLKLNFDESAYRQLRAMVEPKGN